jgi:hypothetical protein
MNREGQGPRRPRDVPGSRVRFIAPGLPRSPGAAEAGAADTGAEETGAAETGAAETGAAETGAAETGAAETGAAETGAEETGARLSAWSRRREVLTPGPDHPNGQPPRAEGRPDGAPEARSGHSGD